jgi:hypothetical protein
MHATTPGHGTWEDGTAMIDFEPAVARGALVTRLRQVETTLDHLGATDMTELSTQFLSGGAQAEQGLGNFASTIVETHDAIARARQLMQTGQLLDGKRSGLAVQFLTKSVDTMAEGVLRSRAVIDQPLELDPMRNLFEWVGAGPAQAKAGVTTVANALEEAGVATKAEAAEAKAGAEALHVPQVPVVAADGTVDVI